MSQNVITLADLLDNLELGGGSVITSITELEPAAGPHASVAPAKFVDGSKSVFAYENRYIGDNAQKVVLIDSKQSELNRAEAAMNRAASTSTATKQSSRFPVPSSPTRPKTAP